MKTKMMKSMAKLNRLIEDDYQKLSDKYHELELSHNRKKKALVKIRMAVIAIRKDNPQIVPIFNVSSDVLDLIEELCDHSLFSDGRVNERIKHG